MKIRIPLNPTVDSSIKVSLVGLADDEPIRLTLDFNRIINELMARRTGEIKTALAGGVKLERHYTEPLS